MAMILDSRVGRSCASKLLDLDLCVVNNEQMQTFFVVHDCISSLFIPTNSAKFFGTRRI
jgi:hypothetical protein